MVSPPSVQYWPAMRGRRVLPERFLATVLSLLGSVIAHAVILATAAFLVVQPRGGSTRTFIRLSILRASPLDAGQTAPAGTGVSQLAAHDANKLTGNPAGAAAGGRDDRQRGVAVRQRTGRQRREQTARKGGMAAGSQSPVHTDDREPSGSNAMASTGTGTTGSEGRGGGTAGKRVGDEGVGGGAGGGGLRGHCVYCPKPPYPRAALLRGWEGTADVEIIVAPDGRVSEARIHRSSGHKVLDDAAMSVARQSRFNLPQEGNSGARRGRIAYAFRLRD